MRTRAVAQARNPILDQSRIFIHLWRHESRHRRVSLSGRAVVAYGDGRRPAPFPFRGCSPIDRTVAIAETKSISYMDTSWREGSREAGKSQTVQRYPFNFRRK